MGRLRFLTAGESHGEMLVGILEGIPSGLPLIASRDIDPHLQSRQKGYGRGRRQQIEDDRAQIISGVRKGLTTGAPIALLIPNRDWERWQERMSVEAGEEEQRPVTIPRPGHADLAGAIKYGHESDIRNVLERASARETAVRVALGAIAGKLLAELGIEAIGYVRSIGKNEISVASVNDVFDRREQIESSLLKVPDTEVEERMIRTIDEAKVSGDTLGGVVECIVRGVPPGIGSHVQWDRKLDGILSQAVMSIQAVKGVEIGAGKELAFNPGSMCHDPIEEAAGFLVRTQNNAGGIEGGMSNGADIIVRASMKPISTLMQPLRSIDLATGSVADAHIERSDVCAVPALSVIVRHAVALAIASEILETFGGDTMDELRHRSAMRRSRMQLSNLRAKR